MNWSECFNAEVEQNRICIDALTECSMILENIDLTFSLRKILAHEQEVIVMHIFEEALLCIFEVIKNIPDF